jgi:hypothetical protein
MQHSKVKIYCYLYLCLSVSVVEVVVILRCGLVKRKSIFSMFEVSKAIPITGFGGL